MNKLWVDDLHDPQKYFNDTHWVWARTYSEAIELLKTVLFDEISLDNDLGEEKEGRHIFNWIEEQLFFYRFNEHKADLSALKTIYVHTSNSTAQREMMSAKDNFKEKYGIDIILRPRDSLEKKN